MPRKHTDAMPSNVFWYLAWLFDDVSCWHKFPRSLRWVEFNGKPAPFIAIPRFSMSQGLTIKWYYSLSNTMQYIYSCILIWYRYGLVRKKYIQMWRHRSSIQLIVVYMYVYIFCVFHVYCLARAGVHWHSKIVAQKAWHPSCAVAKSNQEISSDFLELPWWATWHRMTRRHVRSNGWKQRGRCLLGFWLNSDDAASGAAQASSCEGKESDRLTGHEWTVRKLTPQCNTYLF